jgi:hypothetical protein
MVSSGKGGREEVRESIKSHAKPPRRRDERTKRIVAKDRNQRKKMGKSEKADLTEDHKGHKDGT